MRIAAASQELHSPIFPGQAFKPLHSCCTKRECSARCPLHAFPGFSFDLAPGGHSFCLFPPQRNASVQFSLSGLVLFEFIEMFVCLPCLLQLCCLGCIVAGVSVKGPIPQIKSTDAILLCFLGSCTAAPGSMQCFSFYAREVVENVGYVGFVKGYVTEKNRFLFSISDLLALGC